MAEITKVVVTDLGTDATHEVGTLEEANEVVRKWCLSLPPTYTGWVRVDVYSSQGLPPTDDPRKASVREKLPTMTVRVPIQAGHENLLDIEKVIAQGGWIDPAAYVLERLLGEQGHPGLAMSQRPVQCWLVQDMLALAPPGLEPFLAEHIKTHCPWVSEMVDQNDPKET